MRATQLNPLFSKSKGFRRNFFTLISGTGIAQALGLIFLPLLTRLYDPEAFGIFGIYYAIICVLGILATWRMEMAIMLPKEEQEARQLWKGTIFLLSGTSSLMTALLLITLLFWQSDQPLIQSWIALSAGVFLIGLSEALMQWHNRQQNFRVLATKRLTSVIQIFSRAGDSGNVAQSI